MKPVLSILLVMLLVSCLEQNPAIPRSNANGEEVIALIHNSNAESYVIYKKEEFDGRFSREFVLGPDETRELTGFSTAHNYFLRAARESDNPDAFEYEWWVTSADEDVYISF